jgi:hypothetical protein
MDNKQLTQEWSSRIANFKSSGQTMSAWCAAHNLSIHQLKYWLKKMNIPGRTKPSDDSTQWLPVTLTGSAKEADKSRSLVIRVGQASIEVSTNFNPNLLREIVRTLTASC